ncbi:flagellar biosynthetic protein FliR [Caldicoprobacter guelmensis]|uniref:flagellar biosynthetic protein FliR n=1 Tax=Caldicoprobacter guelmensis TaxID=1170224 RepID=UPI00195E5E43|nr:flagellar biosynthetic protein FliR [Caldicoprobacter guelmensis]MBM7581396.1 flagellar biosynthetic protein FliR [Caldicoprobacter guelmensis]
MMEALVRLFLNLDTVFLVLARISGMFFMSPVFGRKSVPAIFTIGLILAMTGIVAVYFPVFGHSIDMSSYVEMAFYVVKELLVGIIMGYLVSLAFSAFLLAGQLMDTQIGFGVVHVLDPHTNIQVPLVGNFNNVIAMVLFFAMDGHHTLIRLLLYSFEVVPPGKAKLTGDIAVAMFKMFEEFFVLGLKMAVPVMAAALLAEVVFGILVRIIPQMNIFVIGLPFKILIGLLVLLLTVPVLISIMDGAFVSMFKGIRNVIQWVGLQ